MIPVVSRIVEVCVFRFIDSRAEFLLLRRSSSEPLYPDLWQIVTGVLDGDETATQAAGRELREETGIVPLQMWVVPEVTGFFDPMRNEVNLCPVFGAQAAEGVVVRLSQEHSSFEWLPKPEAIARLVWPSHRRIVQTVDEYIVSGQEAGKRLLMPVP